VIYQNIPIAFDQYAARGHPSPVGTPQLVDTYYIGRDFYIEVTSYLYTA